MDNQTRPRRRGSTRKSTSELHRHAVLSNEESLLPPPHRAPPVELPPPPVELPSLVVKCPTPPPQYKHNARGVPPRQTSDHKALHVPSDKICLEAQNHSEETTEWALLIISVLLEAMSAVFDQVGCVDGHGDSIPRFVSFQP